MTATRQAQRQQLPSVAVTLTPAPTEAATATAQLRRQVELLLANKRAPANEAAFDDSRARLKQQHFDNTAHNTTHNP
ncbi:hypothetical protein ACLKA6_010184 [Drosophila palustris]